MNRSAGRRTGRHKQKPARREPAGLVDLAARAAKGDHSRLRITRAISATTNNTPTTTKKIVVVIGSPF